MAEPTPAASVARRVTLRCAWYDLWVGIFVDTAKRTVYICPLPCVLVTVRRG